MTDTYPGAKEALDHLRPTLLELPAGDITAQRFNAPQAVSNLLKVAGAFAEDRARFEATFKKGAFDPATHDDLATRAHALWQADVEWRQRVEADQELPGLVEEAGPLKNKLFRAADYLWGQDPEVGAHVRAIRSGHGYLDLADDLVALANLLDARWHEVFGKSHVTKDDLARARAIGTAIAAAYGGRSTDENAEALRDLRQRAFHYANLAATAIRNAASYVHINRTERLDAYPSPFLYPQARRPARKHDDGDEPVPPSARARTPADA